ncbi:RHS repeat-associated core domain-containing protein [uncultured Vibrio sp.]|uniref:RHS repeat domain-containing protein n=1 Tax=uncultured Vibrio sp. TaxID=114054 RepID=UPI002AA67277|nr:RHS repeat-associated core domain-containing protein [uncultured Vibrio sp.]
MKSWHRFYDPETGRYISADPIGLAGGINLYAYADQNPINYVDPDGLNPLALPAYEVIKWGGAALIAAFGAKAAKETADAINDASSEECSDPCNNDPNTDKCRRLAEKIANLRKEVYEKRIPDLENNPGNLPERIGPGENLRDTVRGHRKLLNRQWRRLQELEDKYDKECRKKC